jgi:hypothetical protein
MKDPLVSKLPDSDMQAAPRALLRAALRARAVARQTQTPLVFMLDGKLVEEAVSEDLPANRVDEVLEVHSKGVANP